MNVVFGEPLEANSHAQGSRHVKQLGPKLGWLYLRGHFARVCEGSVPSDELS